LGTVVSLGDADPDRSKYIPLGLPKFFVTVDDIAVGSIDTDVSVLLVLYIEVLLVILRALKLKKCFDSVLVGKQPYYVSLWVSDKVLPYILFLL
jgi:hypothetical protein